MSQSGIRHGTSFSQPFCMCLISARNQSLLHFLLDESNDFFPFVKNKLLQGWALFLLLLLSSEILYDAYDLVSRNIKLNYDWVFAKF